MHPGRREFSYDEAVKRRKSRHFNILIKRQTNDESDLLVNTLMNSVLAVMTYGVCILLSLYVSQIIRQVDLQTN